MMYRTKSYFYYPEMGDVVKKEFNNTTEMFDYLGIVSKTVRSNLYGLWMNQFSLLYNNYRVNDEHAREQMRNNMTWLFEQLDKEGVSYRIQNAVLAHAQNRWYS